MPAIIPRIFLHNLAQARNVLVNTNQPWNGDNLGAVFAFAQLLVHHGPSIAQEHNNSDKKVQVIAQREIPPELHFMIPQEFMSTLFWLEQQEITNIPHNDLFVTIGSVPESNKDIVVQENINQIFIAYNAFTEVEPNFFVTFPSSLSEMVYSLYRQLEIAPSQSVALALYSGIMAATNAFRAEKTRPETHAIVAQLLDIAQVNPNMVYQNLFEKKPLSDLNLLRILAPKAKLHYNNQVVALSVPRHELKTQGYSRNDLHRVLDYPFISKQVKVIFLFTESRHQDYTRVIMLSKTPFNAYELLDEWNPLGDMARAEAVIPAPRQKAEGIILERFANLLEPESPKPAQ